MAKTVHDEGGYHVVEISRVEAATLIRDLSQILATGGGAAPGVTVMKHGAKRYSLLFQLEVKTDGGG